MNLTHWIAGLIMATASISLAAEAPKIYAHRGSSAYAPENTTPSMELCFKMNADAVELDVWMSKDGRVMVSHDGNTSRTAHGQNYVINNTDSSVLRQLDVSFDKGEQYKGTRIPFLEEYMKILPAGKQMVLEFKDVPSSVAPVKKILEDSGKMDQVILISFKLDTLTEGHKQMPNLKTYYLASAKKGVKPAAIDPNVVKEAKDAGFTGVDLDYRYLTDDLVKAIRAAGLGLVVWTVDKPEDIERMVKIGVDGITTNKPDTTRAAVEQAMKK
jgi:glycerophosphoryl diester phosphodiesterase